MMGECTKRELHSPQPSLLQLQLLWSSTSCKLQELSVLTTEAESLEQCFRCLYSEYVSFQTDRRAAESAVIVEAHTGIGIAAEQSALAVDVDALRREISFEKQELKGHTNVWRALRQGLITECEELIRCTKDDNIEEVQQNEYAECTLQEADLHRKLKGKGESIPRLKDKTASFQLQTKVRILHQILASTDIREASACTGDKKSSSPNS